MNISDIACATTSIEEVVLKYGAKMMLYAAVQYLIEQRENEPVQQHHLAYVRNHLLAFLWPDLPSAPGSDCVMCGG